MAKKIKIMQIFFSEFEIFRNPEYKFISDENSFKLLLFYMYTLNCLAW